MLLASVDNLPTSIKRLINLAVEYLSPSKIILFGSQADGSAKEYSDFDLAFFFPPEKQANWLRFKADVEEKPITLRKVDLINYQAASEELKQSILTSGIIVFQSN